MSDEQLIQKTADYVKDKLSDDTTGHDWWHIARVWELAKTIGKEEKADMLVIELGALLHDIADWKFHDGDEEIGPRVAREWLESLNTDTKIIKDVEYIVRHVSFKGGTNKVEMEMLEGKIVQDADRLDAIGAIGIARTFAYGGHLGRSIYNPARKPGEYNSLEAFRKELKGNHSINHFYEKLLLLKDLMNTKTAKKMAVHRHKFMEDFLEEFYAEWDGKL